MAKKAEQHRLSKHGENVALEQTSIYDDSLLTSAEELSKLQALDPSCIEWIKQRTEKEQDARIKFNLERVELAKQGMKDTKTLGLYSLSIIFATILLGMTLSIVCIIYHLNTVGTIFGGATLLSLVVVLLRLRIPSK